MDEFYNKHYIIVDDSGRITDGWSDGPHPNRDTSDAICINEQGGYQFRLYPSGEENPILVDWDGIPRYRWDGEKTALRSEDELEAERRPSDEQLAAQARAQRDKLLADCDWTQTLDAPIDANTREAYRAYRQALRDIPEREGFPLDITWPELPAKTKADPDPVDEAVDLLLSGATGEEAAV